MCLLLIRLFSTPYPSRPHRCLSEESSCPGRRYTEASAQTGLTLLDQSPTTVLSAYLNAHAVIRQTPLTTTKQPVHQVP